MCEIPWNSINCGYFDTYRRIFTIFCFGKTEKASGNKVRQVITIHDGINKEEAQSIVKSIKSQKIKIQPSIQGDQIRVTGKKRDDLQLAINFLKTLELKIPISFINFRD